MTRTESVDEWEKILTGLIEAGKVHLTPEENVRGEAWRLAQHEDELTSLRALAAPPTPRRDPDVIQRAILDAEAILAAATTADRPETEDDLREAVRAFGMANAARAIIEALTPLHEQAKAETPRQSGASYAWRPPGAYCAACAARYCECPDRQR